MKIEITHYKPVHKNSCLATFSIKIEKWGNFLIRNISLFEKNNHRWISFPSRQYEEEGKKKYFAYNAFEDRAIMDSFQKKVLESLDEYLKTQLIENKQEEIPF